MTLRNILLLALAGMTLAGCVIDRHPHHHKSGVYIPGLVIEDGSHHNNHKKGHHCPPGQHKKGRC